MVFTSSPNPMVFGRSPGRGGGNGNGSLATQQLDAMHGASALKLVDREGHAAERARVHQKQLHARLVAVRPPPSPATVVPKNAKEKAKMRKSWAVAHDEAGAGECGRRERERRERSICIIYD